MLKSILTKMTMTILTKCTVGSAVHFPALPSAALT